MTDKPPTYRQRAIDTAVNNHSGLRDLIIDMADEVDKMLIAMEPPSTSENQDENQNNKNGA